MIAMLPLAFTNVRAPILKKLSATDASPTGAGSCLAEKLKRRQGQPDPQYIICANCRQEMAELIGSGEEFECAFGCGARFCSIQCFHEHRDFCDNQNKQLPLFSERWSGGNAPLSQAVLKAGINICLPYDIKMGSDMDFFTEEGKDTWNALDASDIDAEHHAPDCKSMSRARGKPFYIDGVRHEGPPALRDEYNVMGRFYPQLRYKMPVARQFFSNWKSVHVPKQAVPLPASVALALAGVAFSVSEVSLGFLILLGFLAFLRTGEITSLTANRVQVHPETGQIILALPATKTSKQKLESVQVEDVNLAILAQHVLAHHPGGAIGTLTPNLFRAKLKLMLAVLELTRYNFTGYSLRRGGASHAFTQGQHFDSLLVKGRWQSIKTARQYLDSGRASLVQLHFSEANHRLIEFFQEGFRRWWRATCMDISAKELLLQRQRAAILVLLRQRTQHAMAMAHLVWSLLEKAFRGFSSGVVEDSDDPPRRASQRVRRGRKNVERGLRGTSLGEVLRKGWRRWRYAVAVGHQVVAPMLHRPNVSLVLGEIAAEIAGLRKVATGARKAKPKRALPPPEVGTKNTMVATRATEEVGESAHLIFLQKALAGFASARSTGLGLEDMSPISLWPETSVATTNVVDVRQVLSPKQQNFRNDERWPSFVTELWSPPAGGSNDTGDGYPPRRWEEKAESWRRMLREADRLPPPPAMPTTSARRAGPEGEEASYEGLRRRALARRLLKMP
eukprot:s52_g4.t1